MKEYITQDQAVALAREAGFPFNKYGLLQADEDGEIEADAMIAHLCNAAIQHYLQSLEPVKGEPVAWMRPNGNLARADAIKAGIPFDDFKDYTIPIYTHQQRELSDDEIIDVLGGELDSSDEAFIRFARAVLEKARNG